MDLESIAWTKMVEEGLAEDEIRNTWKNRIEGGMKGAKKIQVTFEMKTGGVAISEYIIPFEKDLMKNDLLEWTQCCSKITKLELPYP
ncbi:MAG: hypothetical protein WD512_03820 [Candidatus Paceibacterota bacterium]